MISAVFLLTKVTFLYFIKHLDKDKSFTKEVIMCLSVFVFVFLSYPCECFAASAVMVCAVLPPTSPWLGGSCVARAVLIQ